MRGTKAKRIRREVYGDESLKNPREYRQYGQTAVAIGKRREYQDAKRGK